MSEQKQRSSTPDLGQSATAVEEELGRERWTVICWNEDCPDSLDTYGYGDSYLEMAREHVREYGCEVHVSLSRHDHFRPGSSVGADA